MDFLGVKSKVTLTLHSFPEPWDQLEFNASIYMVWVFFHSNFTCGNCSSQRTEVHVTNIRMTS